MNLSYILLQFLAFTTAVVLVKAADDDWDWGDDGFSAEQFSKFNATVLITDYIANFTVVNGTIPYPFSPPVDDDPQYCDANELYQSLYISFFAECNFTFYNISESLDPYTCPTGIEGIKEQRRVFWPDSCVALGERCYLIEENPELFNYTFVSVSGKTDDYKIAPFPISSGYVSVDCSADYELAEEFMDNLPENIEEIAGAMVAMIVLFILVVSICCGCLCCGLGTAIGAFCCRPRRKGYDSVPMATNVPVATKYAGPALSV